jgi:hypothetical protein
VMCDAQIVVVDVTIYDILDIVVVRGVKYG